MHFASCTEQKLWQVGEISCQSLQPQAQTSACISLFGEDGGMGVDA